MKKKRFSVEQIVAVLKKAGLGVPVAEVIRKVGISEQTFITIIPGACSPIAFIRRYHFQYLN